MTRDCRSERVWPRVLGMVSIMALTVRLRRSVNLRTGRAEERDRSGTWDTGGTVTQQNWGESGLSVIILLSGFWGRYPADFRGFLA